MLWVGYCTTDTVTALYLLLSLPLGRYTSNTEDIFHLITSRLMHNNAKQDELNLHFMRNRFYKWFHYNKIYCDG